MFQHLADKSGSLYFVAILLNSVIDLWSMVIFDTFSMLSVCRSIHLSRFICCPCLPYGKAISLSCCQGYL